MPYKPKLMILLLSTVIVFYGLIGGLLNGVSAGDDPYGPLSIFNDVLHRLKNDYVEEPNMQEAFNGALQGMMETLDPYSSFVDATVYREFSSRTEAHASPGIVVSKRYGYGYVVSVLPDSPAAREGIRTGDLIESMEGRPAIRMSLWEIEARLRGEENSKVAMRVVRARRTEPTEVELNREKTDRRKVEAKVVDSGIGLLRIPDLSSGVSSDVETRLKMLMASGMTGLLVDLRGNATGSLEEASKVADLMLPKGVKIVTVSGRDGSSRTHASLSEPLLPQMPIVLLLDGGTSGPAEVLSAALRDNLAATVVGERTNGRGSEQTQFPVAGGSVLVMTTEMYAAPKGEAIQGETVRQSGLRPDVRAPSQDFVTAFYFENTTEDLEESLNDEFYRKLDEAIAQEQLSDALDSIREKVLKKAA